MSRKKHSYSMGIVGLPSVLVALSWLALWLVWPTEAREVVNRKKSSFKVSYVQLDVDNKPAYLDLIVLLRDGGTLDDQQDNLESLSVYHARPPIFLERSPSKEEPIGVNIDTGISREESEGLTKDYKPDWHEKRVFSKSIPQERQIVLDVDGELSKSGFHMPEFPDEMLKGFTESWQVVANVEISDGGIPEHVFLLTRSEDQKVNDMVVKSIERGWTTISKKKCSGRITVSFGIQ